MRLLAAAVLTIAAAAPLRAEVPSVAADIAPVHGLVARVMQGVGAPDLILPPGASPHGYSMRPSEARALSQADVVFWVGEDLTPALGRAMETLAEDAESVALLEQDGTLVLPFREGVTFAAAERHAHEHGDEHDEHGHADHTHEDHTHDDDRAHDGHDHDEHAHDEHAHDEHAHDEHHHDHNHAHDGADPHAWLDPENGKRWLALIAETLAARDPANADAYRANALAGQAEIDTVIAEIETRLADLRGVSFIVFHDAYQYFESRVGLSAAGAISPADAMDPSAGRVAEIRDAVAAQGIRCAFAEPQFDPGLIGAVFEGTDVEASVIDPLGTTLTPGPDFYPALLRGMADAFATCR